MRQPITLPSPAKLNLFLHVHQQRADGYHDLKTYFQLVDLCDYLTFTVNHDGMIRVDNPTLDVSETEDLCFKAATLLQADSQSSCGITIQVEKNIPDGGGLGGGSSNAATVLYALNQLWQLHLPETRLRSLALKLGADVPVFVYGQSTYAEGRGEIFSPHLTCDSLAQCTIVIIKPRCSISTATIFHHPRLTKRPSAGIIPDLETVYGQNDFQSIVFDDYPELAKVAEQISRHSPAYLTGTGACLFTVLDDKAKADKIAREFSEQHDVFIVKPLLNSPLKNIQLGVWPSG